MFANSIPAVENTNINYESLYCQLAFEGEVLCWPSVIFKKLLEKFHQTQSSLPTNNYYFWVGEILNEFRRIESSETNNENAYADMIINRINEWPHEDISSSSDFSKILAAFLSFNFTYYTAIRPELLTSMKVIPFALDWKEVGEQITANITSEVDLTRRKAYEAFDDCRHFLSNVTLNSIFRIAFKNKEVKLLVKVLQIQPLVTFEKNIKAILSIPFSPYYTSFKCPREIGLDVINELFGSFSLRDEYLVLAYNYFLTAMKDTYTGTYTKIPLLIKFNKLLPGLVTRNFLSPVAEENFLCLIKNYCENYTNLEEAIKIVKSCEDLFDNFYYKLFKTFVQYFNAYERRMLFICKQVDLLPDEFKFALLSHVVDDRIFARDFNYMSEYVKKIYLSASATVKTQFEEYLIPKLTGNSYRDHLEYRIWANFLTYGKTASEAVTLLLEFFNLIKPRKELWDAIMLGFVIDGYNFLTQESAFQLAEAMFPKIEIGDNAFSAAKVCKGLYKKLRPEHQLIFQHKMTVYINSALVIKNDKKSLYALVDISFGINNFTPETTLDEKFNHAIKLMIGHTFKIISRFLRQHYLGDLSKWEKDEVKDFSDYLWYGLKILSNLAIYTSDLEKKFLFETIYIFLCYKEKDDKTAFLNYLLDNFHNCHIDLQKKIFRSYVNSFFGLETTAGEDFNHLFKSAKNEDELQGSINRLYKLSVRPDNTIIYENAHYIINHLAKDARISLLSYLDAFGNIPHTDLEYYAMLKCHEYSERKDLQEKRFFIKNVCAASLFHHNYHAKIKAELMEQIPVSNLVEMVTMYL
jgi:hypothetical protein